MSTYHGIEIKKSHKGLFTKKAKEHGSSVQKYASHVLANKDKYTAETVKQANFARNAKKFKHKQNGGGDDQAASNLLKQYQQQNPVQNGLQPPGSAPLQQNGVTPQQSAVNNGFFDGYMNSPYDNTPIPPFQAAQPAPKQYKNTLNPYVQDANALVQGTTAVADFFNDINGRRQEHQQYEKAIQPRAYRNNDQQGLNPLPAYTQFGGFGNNGMPYLPYLDPHYKQAIAPYQNGGDINEGIPYLPYLDPCYKQQIAPYQNGGQPKHVTKQITDDRGLTSVQFDEGNKQWGYDYLTPQQYQQRLAAYAYPPAGAPVQGVPQYNFANGVVPTAQDSVNYARTYNDAVNNPDTPNAPYTNPNGNVPATSADNARFDAQQFLLNTLKAKKGMPPLSAKDKANQKELDKYHKQNGGDINEGIPYLPYENPISKYDPNCKYVFQNGGGLSSDKAKEILRDGTANGKPLTAKQKRYMGWVAGGKKQNGGTDIASNQPVTVNPQNAPAPVVTPPVPPPGQPSNAPAQNLPAPATTDPDAYYKANATLQYFKTQLNSQLQAKNPQAYQDYLGGLQKIQTDPTIPVTQKVAARQQYAQTSNYNDYLAPEDVKKSLGSDYDTYIQNLQTVSQYNQQHGQQPLYGQIEGENDPTKLNYGRRFATMTTNPSVDSTTKHTNGTNTTVRKTYTYNPKTKQVELTQSALQNGGYAEGQEVDLSPEEYQQLLAQGYELEQLDGSARPNMS